MSPSCRDNEVTLSGTEDIQVVHPSTPTKSLIRQGIFGLRVVSPHPVVLKEVLPVLKKKDPTLEEGSSSGATVLLLSQVCSSSDGATVLEPRRESGTPFNSSVSMS